MNEKFTLKLIQQGQAQKIHIVTGGAGLVGNAVVIKAADATRYQLTNVVTLASPEKLQIMRKGSNLLLALPGGDIDAPDIVINGYFDVKGAALFGVSVDGEWSAYNTSVLNVSAPTLEHSDISMPEVNVQPLTNGKAVTASLGAESFFANSWVWGGVVGVAAAVAGKSGGGGAATAHVDDPLAIITAYAGGGTRTAPTATEYAKAGVTLPTVSAVTADNVALAINAVVANKTSADVATVAQLNTLATALGGAYSKILAEANGVAVDATPSSNPTSADYASIGVTATGGMEVAAAVLALLNDAVGLLNASSVDAVSKIANLEKAAENLIAMAAGGGDGLSAAGVSYTTPAEWVSGLTALGVSGVTLNNIANIKAAIDTVDQANTGAAVNTVAKIQQQVSWQVFKDFTNDPAIIGSKTASTPTLVDWSAVGLTANTSLADNALTDIATAGYWKTTNPVSGLAALNSALDYQFGSASFLPALTGSVANKATLQSIVNSYGRILQEADGSRTFNTDVSMVDASTNGDLVHADFTNIGATVGTTTHAERLLIDVISGLTNAGVDTVDEINALATIADNVMKLGQGSAVTYTDGDWINALGSKFGLTGITTSNIGEIKAAIAAADAASATAHDGSAIDTYGELQAIISIVRINDYSNLTSGYQTPTITDYQVINSNANTSYLGAYNDAESYAHATQTKGWMSSMITSYNTILAEANGALADTTPSVNPSVTDYANIGVTVHSATNTGGTIANSAAPLTLLNDAIANLTIDKVDSTSELTKLEAIVNKVMSMAANSHTVGVSADYAGGVTSAELLGLGFSDTGVVNKLNNMWNYPTQLTNVYNSVIASADDGTGVNSLAKLQTMILFA